MIDEGFQIYNLSGERQMSIPLSTAKYGADRVCYHRVDLHEALKARATSSPSYPGSPAVIKTSSRVISCDCESGTVILADNTSLTADLIIGADGIKSSIRQSVLSHDIAPQRTGHSAYRMVIPTSSLLERSDFTSVIDPLKSYTTMVIGHDKRLIMGPARNSSIYSIVAMVPDETLNEDSTSTSWTTPGNLSRMLETFADFPEWAKAPLKLAKEAGLWQLRDLDPLETWYRGRTILIGDAAHAMLPTQGQGASQSIEDAEALGAFFEDFEVDCSDNVELQHQTRGEHCEEIAALPLKTQPAHITTVLKHVFNCRYSRATMIQAYSRQTARPATGKGDVRVKMNPAELMDYNCYYDGARDWLKRQREWKETALRERGENTGIDDEKTAEVNVGSIEVGMRAMTVQ